MIKLIEEKKYNNEIIKNYELKNNNGASAQIISFGARIHKLFMPDRNGNFLDVVAGFNDILGYTQDNPHFNGIVGRVANRIGDAKFVLNGKEYVLDKNDGQNHLHGGTFGFDNLNWDSEIIVIDNVEKLRFTHFSPDGEENYPANLNVIVEYTLTDENELVIDYFAESDGDTHCNLTNHAYFNLSGDFTKDILNHSLEIKSSAITAIDSGLIPKGEIFNTDNTPISFKVAKTIGCDIKKDNVYLSICGGYDFNYVLDDNIDSYLAKATSPESGITLEVYSDQPCVQLYTGNFLNNFSGKQIYNKHAAFCLETQNYPNACNVPSFKSTLLKKGQKYTTKTVYKFLIED